jgi:uncharacterized protein YjiS (DUF1127 family)
MSAIQLSSRGRQRRSAGLVARVGAFASRVWWSYWEWRAKKATVQMLRALDGRTLKDIGLTPGEIESTVYGKRGDRLRQYQHGWNMRSGS